jgi:hypothetical protein
MFNAWDFVFLALLLFSAWLGWRLKSLPLLGMGFALALAPLLARRFSPELATFLVENLGGQGLKPHEEDVAWWTLFLLSALLLILLFRGFSKMLATLKLELLDKAFGAFVLAGFSLAMLSLNLGNLRSELKGEKGRALVKSWSWAHLRTDKSPAWLEKVEEKLKY